MTGKSKVHKHDDVEYKLTLISRYESHWELYLLDFKSQ